MLEEGRSYSGYERNSAFLNLGAAADGTPRYADVSGACGLDTLDDGRSIGVTDWDFDGRLDFWITNRTAPRLRLQQNRSVTKNTFVGIRLLGQAIGARVRLTVNGKPHVRTVRAGQGFLAQSSAWLHFGLPQDATITRAEVRWPGQSEYQAIEGLRAGQFFTLTKGQRNAQAWQAPQQPILHDAKPITPPSQRARIVMASPLPFPATSYQSFRGEARPLLTHAQPMLVNLWATWCHPCLTEMQEWNAHQAALNDAGLHILALSVDDVDAPLSERQQTVQRFLNKHALTLETGLATTDFLETLEVAGRALLDKFETLPIPSSLLIDTQGRAAFLYKGPVSSEQLLQDVAKLGAPDEARHLAAAHFPGTWMESPWPATPTVMIDKFMSFGKPTAAKRYLDTFTSSTDQRAQQDLSESYYLVANELRIQKRELEAIRAYERAHALAPHKHLVRLELATLLFKHRRYGKAVPHLAASLRTDLGNANTRKMLALSLVQTNRSPEAVPHFEILAQATPGDGNAHLWLGHSLKRAGQPDKALIHLRQALRILPNAELAANELAWILATSTQDEIRNPQEALIFAQRALESAGQPRAGILDTLAAAQAANGDFAAAAKTATHALKLAEAAGNATLANAVQQRLILYQQRQPYREPSAGK